jgi:ABC-type multidrug transport system ATPase subunit
MGSSGAGKTTLLNALAGRIQIQKGHELSGKVMVNDSLPLTQDNFGHMASYVMQDDMIFEYFTPK